MRQGKRKRPGGAPSLPSAAHPRRSTRPRAAPAPARGPGPHPAGAVERPPAGAATHQNSRPLRQLRRGGGRLSTRRCATGRLALPAREELRSLFTAPNSRGDGPGGLQARGCFRVARSTLRRASAVPERPWFAFSTGADAVPRNPTSRSAFLCRSSVPVAVSNTQSLRAAAAIRMPFRN